MQFSESCISLKEKNDYNISLNVCKTAYRELLVKHSVIESQLPNRSSSISNDEDDQSAENSKKFTSSHNNTARINLTLSEYSFASFLLYGIQRIQRALEENIDLKNVKIFIENIEERKQDNVTENDVENEVWNSNSENIHAYNDSLHEKSFDKCACKKIFHILNSFLSIIVFGENFRDIQRFHCDYRSKCSSSHFCLLC